MSFALVVLIAALGALAASIRYRAVVAAFAAVVGFVAAATSLAPEQAAPGAPAIALAFTAIAAGLIVIGQVVWKALEEEP